MLVPERQTIPLIRLKNYHLDNIKSFRDKFNIPVTDDEIENIPYVRPPEDSPEMQYLKNTRAKLGGPIPRRRTKSEVLSMPDEQSIC